MILIWFFHLFPIIELKGIALVVELSNYALVLLYTCILKIEKRVVVCTVGSENCNTFGVMRSLYQMHNEIVIYKTIT